MKKLVKLSLLAAFVLTVGSLQAQKFGYVVSAAILQEMPEVKQMESNLTDFQGQLKKKADLMLSEYEGKRKDAADKEAAGSLSPVQKETLIKELSEKEQEIVKFQQTSEQQLLEKQQKLLEPILEKVNTAIQAVAKEGGYQFIFDGSPGTGILLFAEDSTNVTNAVKAKLGI